MVAAPMTPLSWCMQPPYSFTVLPLIASPRTLSSVSTRMPKVSTRAASTSAPPSTMRASARYTLGASTYHSFGCFTYSRARMVSVVKPRRVSACVSVQATSPASSTRSICSDTLLPRSPSLTTVTSAITFATSPSAASVASFSPSMAMCTGSATNSETGR